MVLRFLCFFLLLANNGMAFDVPEGSRASLHVDIAVGNTIAKIPSSQARLARTGQKKIYKYELYAEQLEGSPEAITQVEFFPDIIDNTYLPPSYVKQNGPPFVTEHDCWDMSTALLKVTMKDGSVKKIYKRLRVREASSAKFRLLYKDFQVATGRAFGVEMELVAPDSFRPGKVRDRIKHVTDQESVVLTGYNTKTMRAWKIETDNTIRAPGGMYGLELVTPILRGEGGINLLAKVANEVSKQGCTANDSCGLHIHYDLTGVKFAQLKRLCQNWVKYEDAFDLLLPPGRRASNNQYCLSVRSNMRLAGLSNQEAHELIDQQTTIEGLVKLMNAHPDNRNRYHKLNLQNLVSKTNPRNTVEFRGPPGTCKPDKIERWVRLFDSFIEASIQKTNCYPFKDKTSAKDKKRRLLYKFLA